MNSILKGKTKEEIIFDFCQKNDINVSDYDKLQGMLKKAKKPSFVNKNWNLLWVIPMMIIGFSFLIALTWAGMDHDGTFPSLIKAEDLTFIQKMINTVWALFLFTLGGFAFGIPIKKLFKMYE